MNENQLTLIVGLISPFLIIALITYLIYSIRAKNKKIKELTILCEKYIKQLEIYKPIIKLDDEISNRKDDLKILIEELIETKDKYKRSRETYLQLLNEISIYENDIELIEFGIYKPQFNFDDTEKYKEHLNANIQKQKNLIADKNAAVCHASWTIDGSAKKGEIMTNRAIKLTLRAFNNECDSLIAKVKWNNVLKIKTRMEKAASSISKLNASNRIDITDEYLALKIEQLFLTHEMEQKKHSIKEEQRRIREEMREEELARREIEKAQKEAEKEEIRYRKALEKAQLEVKEATGDKLNKMTEKIKLLTLQLENAQNEKARAVSRAQITKSGHVYIISNLGSFGKNIYKIGMTRRLDPMDRVRELGDASVPFRFDVHAIIYSDNAPELENQLHQSFDENRVNLINHRKEFFNVSLEEIEQEVKNNFDAEIEFTKLAEAQEYRESLSILTERENSQKETINTINDKFPIEI